MYSKAVYDYFNSSQKKSKLKPTSLSRTNALKRKSTKKKTVVASTNTSTSDRILRSSVSNSKDTHLKMAQNSEKKTGAGFVYDTVQSIWKYAKSFIPNQNSSSVRSHEGPKRIQRKQRNRVSHSKRLPSTCLNTLPNDIFEEKGEFSKESIQPAEVASDEQFNREQQQVDILEEKVNSPIICTEVKQTVTEIQFEKHVEKQSVCQEIELTSETNDKTPTKIVLKKDLKKQTVCRKTNKKTKETFQEKALVVETAEDKQITEIFIKPDTNNETEPENLDVDIIVKSALKAYGRGKRKNKKLHVHFKEDYDNEKPKYSTYRTKILRKSDCVHPNVFFKKLNKFPRKKSNLSIRGKKRRLTLCTASSSSRSFRKKRLRNCSSTTISVESKLSDAHDNKASKTNGKTPKKYSTYATIKINKKKPTKKSKKIIAKAKRPKTRQQTKNAAKLELEHLAYSTNNDSQKEYNSQLSNMDLQQNVKDTEDNDLFGKNKPIYESENLLENINEFTQFINGEQLND